MSETIRALVGQHDSGRLIEKGKEIVAQGGLAGDVSRVVEQIKQRRPARVILCGEMLSICVRIAATDLLKWEDEDGVKPLQELIIDLSNSRSFGSVKDEATNGGFNPTLEELDNRRLAIIAWLPHEVKEDPRLRIVDRYEG